ncbi:MAM and LDL-receptor class A domain-containing protein 1-like isoform X1 [Mizuhopecten yessoensis]|nr:MAM and LDL-receptor class A domain-containing protein 1-like isoform X1 [Mizuhopecten yessoensis]
MCHAIGQMHEQSRSDRDNYVTMLWDNIRGGRGNNNMAKDNTLDNNNYDHESVLQYSLWAFNSNGKPTMEFTDRRLDFLANSANGLTFYDIKDITDAYQCTRNCPLKLCENGGFLDHTCACYCPDGLKGDRCQLVDTDSNCGGIIDVSGGPATITSPNYPNNYNVNSQCTWLVKGGATDYVKVDIDDLHLTDNNAGRCYHWLEVQYNLIGQTGPRRCGVVQGENYITSIDGYPNLMLLRFDSKFSSDRPSSKGFSLTVRSVGSGCATSPCLQGTCSTTSGNGFTCTCDQGFSGQTCNIPSVSSSFSCTFEGGNCFLVQATDDNFDWTINSGSTPSTGTGPDSAQSGNNYLYAEGSSPRVSGDLARMSTNLNFPATDRCLRFWYFMYGNFVGQLAVATSGTTTSKANIWSLSGDQGQTWTQVSVNVPSTEGLQIFFETTRGPSWNSDIAIDTVELTPGLCSSVTQPPTQAPRTTTTTSTTTTTPTTTTPTDPCVPNPCNNGGVCLSGALGCLCQSGFAGRFCDLTVTEYYSCTFENAECFLRDSTNDNYNWTLQTAGTPSSNTGPSSAHTGSNYIFYEVSSPATPGETAKLETYNAIPAMDRCLSFWYHMYGGSVGNLQISTTSSGVLWTKSGDQGDMWVKATVNLPADPSFQLYIEATRGNNWDGDIALDDVELIDGTCPQLPCDLATTCLNGGTCLPGIGNGFTCSCVPGFSGVTCQNPVGGPCPAAQDPCLNGGICTVTGSVTSCACVGGFTGQFCGNAGSTPAPTAPPTGTTFRCTFEAGAPCFLSQETLDTFDWTFPKTGSTPSVSTGPNSASEGTSYAFIEASSPRSHGEVALLMSSILPMETLCLTFDYHMYGSSMGDLRVLINDVSSAALNPTMRVLWTESGDQGNTWQKTAIQIPATPSLRVFFEGIRGTGYTSDVAIDDVVLSPGYCGCIVSSCQNGGTCSEDALGQVSCTCPPGFSGGLCETLGESLLHCSFEDGAHCFLHQDQQDDFDWSTKSGSTPSSDTGPSSAFEGNKYAFIETSRPRIEYEIAEFYADLGTNSAQRCLSFAYHMYGSGIGSLEISHLDSQQVMTLWLRAGNQGNNWETASVQIPAMNNGQIYITGVRGDDWSGDIAIDDVELKTGTCGCFTMPCRNGGTCTNDNSAVGFVCTCDAGFTGVLCENPDGSVPVTCTFEDGAYCFLEQVNAAVDIFDWTIKQGGTPSSNTGPDNAHTGSKYAFIEASSPRISGDNAILSSEQTTFLPMNRCLRFYFHMKGTSIGDLIVLSGERGSETTVWSLSGAQGNDWVYTEVSLPTAADLVIAIEGVRGSDWSGDIAIDDLELSAGLC